MKNYKYAMFWNGKIVSGSQSHSKNMARRFGNDILRRNGLEKLFPEVYISSIRKLS